MAEALEIKLKDVRIATYKEVAIGELHLDDDETKEFEKEQWKAFVHYIGKLLSKKYEEKIASRECIINFFSNNIKDVKNHIKKQNINLEGHSIFAPLFHVRYDKNQEIISCNRSEKKIPNQLRFIVLCIE